jgi:hypothetical protein
MDLKAYKRKVRDALKKGLKSVEEMLLDLERTNLDAQQELSKAEHSNFRDYLYDQARQSGYADAYKLVVEVGVSPNKVAHNIGIARTMYELSTIPIGNVARKNLEKALNAAGKATLKACKKGLDLFLHGLPYPLPDGGVKKLEDLNSVDLSVAVRFLSASCQVAKVSRTVKFREKGTMLVPSGTPKYEEDDDGNTVILMPLRELKGNGNGLLAISDIKEWLADNGLS